MDLGNQHNTDNHFFTAMISGGLGNQVISFAKVWNFAINNSLILSLDKSYYESINFKQLTAKGHEYHDFQLDQFSLPKNSDGSAVHFENIPINLGMKHFKAQRIFVQKLFPFFFKNFYVHKDLHGFKPPKYKFRLYGNFLELEAIDSMKDLGGSINLPNLMNDDSSNDEYFNDAIHLHVRMGDLIRVMPNLKLTLEYYQTSIEYLRNGRRSPLVVVYSDHETQAHDFLSNLKCKVSLCSPTLNGFTSTSQQFASFMKARNKISSNSSFSASAARLGDKDSITCVPPTIEQIYGKVRKNEGWVVINA